MIIDFIMPKDKDKVFIVDAETGQVYTLERYLHGLCLNTTEDNVL